MPARPEAARPQAVSPPLKLPPLQLPPLFELGRVMGTLGALEALRDALTDPADLLNRHARGNWGDLDAHDQTANGQAILDGMRLLSPYTLPETGEKV